jgi:mycofactocin system glycosyltransferase
LPASFGLTLDPETRRPTPTSLLGGRPARLIRLTAKGASLLDGWLEGAPIGPAAGPARAAGRLVDAGVAHPRPPTAGLDATPGAQSDDRLTFCVVIPVRDDAPGLRRTVASLQRERVRATLVVVDDGSVDPLDAGALLCVYTGGPVRVLRHDRPLGPAAARNLGVREAPLSADAILLLDAGCEPTPRSIEAMLAMLADPAVAIAAPRVVTRVDPGTPATLGKYETFHSPLDLGERESGVWPGNLVSYVPSAAMMVRRAALDEVGGFDISLRYGEDVDLVWRLSGSGWRVRYIPWSEVSHPARGSWAAWLRQRFSYGRSAAALAARHGSAVAPLALTPATAAVWALALAGRPEAAGAVALTVAHRASKRAPSDPDVAAEIRRQALRGILATGPGIARAVRRAWLLPAVVLGVALRRLGGRRARRTVAIAAVATLFLAGDGRRTGSPGLSGRAYGILTGTADDLAYQAGLWTGAVEHRSLSALLPRTPPPRIPGRRRS